MDDWESLATSGQTLVTTNEVTEAKDIEAKKDVHVPQTQAPNPKKVTQDPLLRIFYDMLWLNFHFNEGCINR